MLVSIFAAGIINLHYVGCDCRQWDNRITRYRYLYQWTVTANLSLDLVHRWHIPASLHVRHRPRRIQVALIRDRKPKGSKFLTFRVKFVHLTCIILRYIAYPGGMLDMSNGYQSASPVDGSSSPGPTPSLGVGGGSGNKGSNPPRHSPQPPQLPPPPPHPHRANLRVVIPTPLTQPLSEDTNYDVIVLLLLVLNECYINNDSLIVIWTSQKPKKTNQFYFLKIS